MKSATVAALALAVLASVSHISAPSAEAQCAQCIGPDSDPCRWGPFIDGGAKYCEKLANYNGCVTSGNCREEPQEEVLVGLSLTPDGFLRRGDVGLEFTQTTLDSGTWLFRTCTGLLQSIALCEQQQRDAESSTVSITI